MFAISYKVYNNILSFYYIVKILILLDIYFIIENY